MSIRFVCTCGKHLRAREDMAARRTVCPACGRPVGIPSLNPSQRGAPPEFPSAPAPSPPGAPATAVGFDALHYEVVPLSDQKPTPEPNGVPRYKVVPVGEEGPVLDPRREAQVLEEQFGRTGSGARGATDTERARRQRERDDEELDELLRRTRRRRRPRWGYETAWYECLLFPLRASPLLVWLAGALTLLVGAAALELPKFPELPPSEQWLWFVWIVLPFLALGYIAGVWHCVLSSAITGEAGFVRWPGKDLRLVVEGLWRCSVCFVFGPVVVLVAGYLFWLNAGDMQFLDWLLLAEASFVASSYWLLALVACAEADNVRQATPLGVVRTIRRLGWRALIATTFFFAAVMLHGLWSEAALAEIHRSSAAGWFSLWCCSLSALACMAFLMRWLGVSSFLSRQQAGMTPVARGVGERLDGT
jgi:hypothetical protein